MKRTALIVLALLLVVGPLAGQEGNPFRPCTDEEMFYYTDEIRYYMFEMGHIINDEGDDLAERLDDLARAQRAYVYVIFDSVKAPDCEARYTVGVPFLRVLNEYITAYGMDAGGAALVFDSDATRKLRDQSYKHYRSGTRLLMDLLGQLYPDRQPPITIPEEWVRLTH